MIVGLLSPVATREADSQSALIGFVGAVMSGVSTPSSGERATRNTALAS